MSQSQTVYSCRWAQTPQEKKLCFSIRQEVFVEEQGFIQEFDRIDDTAYHLLVLDGDTPVATARLFQNEQRWVVGRICVRRPYRGKGLGRLLLEQTEQKARELGAGQLTLDAQVRVKDFYEKLGYYPTGEPHLDEGCPHIGMTKSLPRE